jgi:hypothetical protein
MLDEFINIGPRAYAVIKFGTIYNFDIYSTIKPNFNCNLKILNVTKDAMGHIDMIVKNNSYTDDLDIYRDDNTFLLKMNKEKEEEYFKNWVLPMKNFFIKNKLFPFKK